MLGNDEKNFSEILWDIESSALTWLLANYEKAVEYASPFCISQNGQAGYSYRINQMFKLSISHHLHTQSFLNKKLIELMAYSIICHDLHLNCHYKSLKMLPNILVNINLSISMPCTHYTHGYVCRNPDCKFVFIVVISTFSFCSLLAILLLLLT